MRTSLRSVLAIPDSKSTTSELCFSSQHKHGCSDVGTRVLFISSKEYFLKILISCAYITCQGIQITHPFVKSRPNGVLWMAYKADPILCP